MFLGALFVYKDSFMEEQGKTCCFFGHRDSPNSIKPKLAQTIEYLIKERNITHFYVGTHGSFDGMVYRILKTIKIQYPNIKYDVILAYLPGKKEEYQFYDEAETILPDGIEVRPRKYAIDYRNRWLLSQSEVVVCYITRSFGGASKYVEIAGKQGKEIINLANK